MIPSESLLCCDRIRIRWRTVAAAVGQTDQEQQANVTPLMLNTRPGPNGRGHAITLQFEHASFMVGQSTGNLKAKLMKGQEDRLKRQFKYFLGEIFT